MKKKLKKFDEIQKNQLNCHRKIILCKIFDKLRINIFIKETLLTIIN